MCSNVCVLLRRQDISPVRGQCSTYWLLSALVSASRNWA